MLGGAIYAQSATLNVVDGAITANAAQGGDGGNAANYASNQAGKGASGMGGGIYEYGSTVNLTGTNVANNDAVGGVTGLTYRGGSTRMPFPAPPCSTPPVTCNMATAKGAASS